MNYASTFNVIVCLGFESSVMVKKKLKILSNIHSSFIFRDDIQLQK